VARVVVIGSGAGGLATAARLATRRHDVVILESAAEPGGRLRPVLPGDGTTSPAVTLVPEIVTLPAPLRDLFNKTGGSLDDVLELHPAPETLVLDAVDSSALVPSVGPSAIAAALADGFGAAVEPAYRQLMSEAAELWQVLRTPLLETPGGSSRWLLDAAGGLRGLRLVRPQVSFARACSDVPAESVRALLDLEAIDAGSLPTYAPAWTITRPYVRALFGEWTVPGGFAALAAALVDRATARGATIRTDCHVTGIDVKGARVTGVRLANGDVVPADWVVADIDGLEQLLPRISDPGRSSLDLSTLVIVLHVPSHHIGPRLREREVDGRPARVTVLPANRVAAARELMTPKMPTDAWVRIERSFDSDEVWVVRMPVNAGYRVDDATVPSVLRLLSDRGVLTSTTDGLRVLNALSPAAVAAHLQTVGGRLSGAARRSPRRGLLRPPMTTDVGGLLRAGGGVVGGPGLPYAIQSGEVIAEVIGRPRASSDRSPDHI